MVVDHVCEQLIPLLLTYPLCYLQKLFQRVSVGISELRVVPVSDKDLATVEQEIFELITICKRLSLPLFS